MRLPQCELESVTKLAKFLKIKGLTTEIDDIMINSENEQISSSPAPVVRSHCNSTINGATNYTDKKPSNENAHDSSFNVGSVEFEEERHR